MKYESIEDIIHEMRDKSKACPFVLFLDVEIFADRIEAAWKRERVAIEADVMEQCLLGDAARISIKPAFDKAEFDNAVSGPSAWDAVSDPVDEIRKMRGNKEARHD